MQNAGSRLSHKLPFLWGWDYISATTMQASQFQNLHAQELVVGPIMKPLTLIKKCELLYCCIIFEHVYFIAYDICIVFHSGPRSLANLQHLIIECTTSLREVAARKWNKENSVVCSYEFYYSGLEGQKIVLSEKKIIENLNDWGWVSLFPAFSCSFSCFL